jgi:hypothetical protein
MPEFILDHGSPESARQFQALDSFTQGYIEAMFFTDCEPGTVRPDPDEPPGSVRFARVWNPETDSSLPGDVTFANLAPAALAKAVADCQAFQTANTAMLERAYVLGEAQASYDESAAGRDFWYTRNGHGVGYWDRGLGEVGIALAAACGWNTPFDTVDSYAGDDGLIYLA